MSGPLLARARRAGRRPARSLVVAPGRAPYSLVGDPSFDDSAFSGAVASAYSTLLTDLSSSATTTRLNTLIATDDLYYYARLFHTHIDSAYLAFRLTGDLRILDHIDYWMDQLWSRRVYGHADGQYSQFIMWRAASDAGFGTDRKIDDLKLQALIAQVADLMEENRSLASPGGRNYAASADRWVQYITATGAHTSDGFAAKMPVVHGSPQYGFSKLDPHSDCHSWHSWMKGCYFLHKLTGESGWLQNATRSADILWTGGVSGNPNGSYSGNPEYRLATSPGGDAYVWMSNVHWRSSSRNYLMPTNYAQSVFGDQVILHIEDFHQYESELVMQRFARTVRYWHLLRATTGQNPPYAAYTSASDILSHHLPGDIGGDEDRAGIVTNLDTRRTASVWADQWLQPFLSRWDSTGLIHEVNIVVRDNFLSSSSVLTTRCSSAVFTYEYLAAMGGL
jgi:hypothetical protein